MDQGGAMPPGMGAAPEGMPPAPGGAPMQVQASDKGYHDPKILNRILMNLRG
jgi:hypothetical protein